MRNVRNVREEQVACDIELYFYLNAEKKAWDLTVEDGYCGMSGITQEIFEKLLQDYCLDMDIDVVAKRQGKDKIIYTVGEFDRSKLLQKTIG